jgi:3-hydroxybutyryl-CoA dehydrogenase
MAILPQTATVAVIGCGAMGMGIAQVAAVAGHRVLLVDARADAPAKARDGIAASLTRLVEKGRMKEADRTEIVNRLHPVDSMIELAPASLVIEAVVEDLAVKRSLFAEVEEITSPDAILASNTSSLSITAIAATLQRPDRFVGMHFFNPAPLMALVEVVSGLATDPEVAETIYDTALAWGKNPVHTRSTPGFIVNRVARPFYAEGLRVLQEGATNPATIDALMRESGTFRMGPFELMDLIGHDVNFAVTRSVHQAYFGDPRFQPSLIQQELVDAGRLGRKTGQGFYRYAPKPEIVEPATLPIGPRPARVTVQGEPGPLHSLVQSLRAAGIDVDAPDLQAPGSGGSAQFLVDGCTLALTDGRSATQRAAETGTRNLVLVDLALNYDTASRIGIAVADGAAEDCLARAAGLFQALGKKVSVVDDVPGLIVMRTVAMLVNEAADAALQGVAAAADIDTAMTKGVNYPLGPLAWADRIGVGRVLGVLDALAKVYGEDRYRASALLRRKSWGGALFHG